MSLPYPTGYRTRTLNLVHGKKKHFPMSPQTSKRTARQQISSGASAALYAHGDNVWLTQK